MLKTSSRLLGLLSLLQRPTTWTADQLASELDVDPRTIRRDVARLRDLGYPVSTTFGVDGGYRLDPGATLPPLALEVDAAVAAVLALRASAGEALDKLTHVMPPQLRSTVAAVLDRTSVLDLGDRTDAPPVPVDPATLATLARACREERVVTCTHRSYVGQSTDRRLDPLHLVHLLGRWYLVAHCADEGWHTFRVDRMTDIVRTDDPVYPRTPPADDLGAYVLQSVGAGYKQVTATVRFDAGVDTVSKVIHPAWGTILPDGSGGAIAHVGAESHDTIARWLVGSGLPVASVETPALREAYARLAEQSRTLADPTTS